MKELLKASAVLLIISTFGCSQDVQENSCEVAQVTCKLHTMMHKFGGCGVQEYECIITEYEKGGGGNWFEDSRAEHKRKIDRMLAMGWTIVP